MKLKACLFLLVILVILRTGSAIGNDRIPVLIVDGLNNHDWRTTTEAVAATLRATGRFDVDISSAPEIKVHTTRPFEPKNADDATLAAYRRAGEIDTAARRAADSRAAAAWEEWLPEFGKYGAVVMNFKGRSWPEPMREAFVEYMRTGGGLVLVHASNNSFADWDEFNEIIGLGYNGDRGGATESTKIDPESGKPILLCPGQNSGHGSMHPYTVTVRHPLHPIMRMIPRQWKHGKDELYHNLRGPAKNLQILSSAYSEPKTRGTGHHEPITYATTYGEGRCVVSTMGHFWPRQTEWDSLYCVGFQTILARSTEYVATGRVTLDVPPEFPAADKVSIVPPHRVSWSIKGKATGPVKEERTGWRKKKEADEFSLLTPEEAAEAMVLPEGFVIEAVASEPMVQEPVLCVWDGDGAMYVAEMRSYMQNADGEGTKTMRNGRIKRLTDDDGDGIMDRATVFVDGLNLPRMILPLDDRIAVVETDHSAVWSYRDTDGDGVADEKKILHEGRPGNPKQSVEHQNSGLIWNLDNWIYTSYGNERYRFTDGEWVSEPMLGHWAQWGLDRDDEGRIFYSDNRMPAKSIQMHRTYWDHIVRRSGGKKPKYPPTLGEPFEKSFLVARNLAKTSDRGGAAAERKGFTSTCGQSVFRGDRLPGEFRGDYFVCDPTIHVVRRAVIGNANGKLLLSNPHRDEEFLLSSDFNFRPVNTATGPDGCLYVVDMYRGIIQDSPWYDENARKFARGSGIDRHIQNGRIWRIRHRDHRPSPVPKMFGESTVELVRHFDSPNGWIRDTAQKLILLREDRESVAPLLEGLARFDLYSPLFRLHALWTLEGMGRVSRDLLFGALSDRDPRIRSAAIRVGEELIRSGDEAFLEALKPLAADKDGEVAKQLILSLGYLDTPESVAIIEEATRNHIAHDGIYLAATTVFWGKNTPFVRSLKDGSALRELGHPELAQRWLEGLSLSEHQSMKMPAEWTTRQKWLTGNGETIFFNTCRTCHGVNGRGQSVPGTDLLLAPPLFQSPRVTGDPETLLRILLHGLAGPIDGKHYGAGVMPPVSTLGYTDLNRVTQVANYIRYAWGHGQEPIELDLIQRVKEESGDRIKPWTIEELEKARK